MQSGSRPLAIVTGASQGIDSNVAMICAHIGYDLILAADGTLHDAAFLASGLGVEVEMLSLDLADEADLEELYLHVKDLRVDLLMVDARDGLDAAFRHLIHRVAMTMRRAGHGKVVIAGLPDDPPPRQPGGGQPTTMEVFLERLRLELQNSGVSFACLRLGADEEAEVDNDLAVSSPRLH